MSKTIASLLSAGDQIIAAKSEQQAAAQFAAQSEWDRLLEAARAELGDELASKFLPLAQQKGFKAYDSQGVYLAQMRPFDRASILIGFCRDGDGNWSTAGVYFVCGDYRWSKSKGRPSSQTRMPVDSLPEAIALCEQQGESFDMAREQGLAVAA